MMKTPEEAANDAIAARGRRRPLHSTPNASSLSISPVQYT